MLTVSLSLVLTGTDDDPRWAADVRPGAAGAPRWSRCCEDGHHTPEAAAAHGSELAAAWLGQAARRLQPPACGALALAKAGR